MFSITTNQNKKEFQFFKITRKNRKRTLYKNVFFTPLKFKDNQYLNKSFSTNNSSFLGRKTSGCSEFLENGKLIQGNVNYCGNILKINITPENKEENINEGRWNYDEHMKFLEAITMYNTKWKMVKKYLETRTKNQIRSHAQKFFKKIKGYKDPSIGIDFSDAKLRTLSELINRLKEYEKENGLSDFVLSFLQKVSKKDEEDVIIRDNKIMINSKLLFGKKNDSNDNVTQNKIIELEENIDIKKSKKKKIINKCCKICRFKKPKKNKKNDTPLKNKKEGENENTKKEEKEKDDKKEIKSQISENTSQSDGIGFDNNFKDDFDFFFGDMKVDANNNNTKFSSFSTLPDEQNTVSIMNKNYFC